MRVVPSFSDLKKALKLINPDFKKIRIAVLGDSATQLICTAIKGMAKLEGFEIELYEAEYDQLKQEIIDTDSALYQFEPEFILLFHSTQKLAKSFYKKDISKKEIFANDWMDEISYFLSIINQHLKTNILFLNFVETDDAIFGNYGLKTRASLNYNIKSINYKLMEMSHLMKNLFVVDLNNLANKYGNQNIADPKIYITTDTIFSIEFIPQLARLILDILLPFTGKFKKCVILDLDNTTWGGIIGDDGIENIQIGDLGIGKAFTEFQYWIKQLKERGIILAVCSKNTEHIAKEPFEKHPDMVLRLDDISVFVANWENKADNIRYIQSILNIGFDSMVFLDDNPFERNIVRENIPQICVPELPEDPAEYLPYLKTQGLFETISFTQEDQERTKLYQEEANRTVLQHKFTNEDEFLQNLEMECIVEPITKFTLPRVAQLSQRSNQFNLRTIRYSDEAIQAIMDSYNYFSLTFTLKDKYGDYGLISEIILENQNNELFIETWIMSCRVLKRNVENFVLNNIVQLGRENGFSKIIGEYIPTAKNAMVADHYKNLGFEETGNGFWILEINKYKERKNYIEKK
jgi:FkbH-like protein